MPSEPARTSSSSSPASRQRRPGDSSRERPARRGEGDAMSTATPRVLILGGGFGGVGAAQKVKDADAEIVLVDRHDYHTFQPLLYQLATGLLEQTAVGHSLRDLVKGQDNAVIHVAPITAID